MEHLLLASTLFLAVHGLFGAIDALYFHLWRERLHARPSSRREHLWHTLRAILFPLWVGLLYLSPAGGLLLWAGAAVVAVDFVLLLVDVLEEPASRAPLGGLSGSEYALHAVLVSLHVATVSLLFAARPLSAWSLQSPLQLSEAWPALTSFVALNLLPGAVLIAVGHILLAVWPGWLPARSLSQPAGQN